MNEWLNDWMNEWMNESLLFFFFVKIPLDCLFKQEYYVNEIEQKKKKKMKKIHEFKRFTRLFAENFACGEWDR